MTTENSKHDAVWSTLYHDITGVQIRDEAWEQTRKRLKEVITWVNLNHGTTFKEFDWQIDAAASVILGYDVTVIAATSDGKSFCYQLIAMLESNRTLLVICPLIALMVEQVLKNTALGITACHLNAAELRTKPELLDEVSRGLYQVVFVCPEFMDPKDKRFMRITGIAKKSVFASKLMGIVVDEAHLVYIWRNFRYVNSCQSNRLVLTFNEAPNMRLYLGCACFGQRLQYLRLLRLWDPMSGSMFIKVWK